MILPLDVPSILNTNFPENSGFEDSVIQVNFKYQQFHDYNPFVSVISCRRNFIHFYRHGFLLKTFFFHGHHSKTT